MKYLTITILILCLVCPAKKMMAQLVKPLKASLNHIALYVYDLQRENIFYRDILQLDSIANPFNDDKHNWFKIGEHSQLHIIKGAVAPIAHDKNTHICFSVAAMDVFIQKLNHIGIAYENWAGKLQTITVRPDGVRQIYLKDPEGFWIEINDDKF